jgi:hypothetical protein
MSPSNLVRTAAPVVFVLILSVTALHSVDAGHGGLPVAQRPGDEDAYRRAVEAMKLPPEEHQAMLARRPWIGMYAELLEMAWGTPQRVTRGRTQVWMYPAVTVTLVEGRVTAITPNR